MIEHPNNTTQEKVWLHFYIPVILYMTILAWIPDVLAAEVSTDRVPYTIVDTAQIRCYSNNAEIEYPKANANFFGQDAQYIGNEPAYKDNGDGTVTDLNTGLMWQSDPGEKMTFKQAVAGAATCRVGGYDDWRLPTIKELYSLILFSGTDPDPMSRDSAGQQPFIDRKYFKFQYGNPDRGERIIDSQFATSTKYVSTTMRGAETMFGVNFADGRIKGYGMRSPRGDGDKTFHVLYVRGNTSYGKNDFKDNGDGTVTDEATGLMWMKIDSGKLKAGKNKDGKLNWQEALSWAENLEYAGYSDWRLPNVKELQSIVDYTRSPATTNSAAIDPVFQTTSFIAESGQKDYPCYWSGTTHASLSRASSAAYVAFGRSFGWMRNRRSGQYQLMDVHGAGSQRSDPKSGDPLRFPHGRGPQGDVIRINNFVRCVRSSNAEPRTTGPEIQMRQAPRHPQQMGERMGPPELDQIVLSLHTMSEIFVIDHSTTTDEAAGHSGGRSGKGGDILYRWGNPQVYRAGDASDQKLFAQHDATWIEPGLVGAGNIMVFNNGLGRSDGRYSSVDVIVPPIDESGHYTLISDSAYGPKEADWIYTDENKPDFFSQNISGAQRLPNGNNLICSGVVGTIFEISPDKKIVWKYIYPDSGGGPGPGDFGPGMGRPPMGGPGGPGMGMPPMDGPGMSGPNHQRGPRIRDNMRRGSNDRRKPGMDGPGGPPPMDGPPGGQGLGTPIFRAYRYGRDYPGLVGKDLTPGKPIGQ